MQYKVTCYLHRCSVPFDSIPIPLRFALPMFFFFYGRMTYLTWYHFAPAMGLAVGSFILNMSTLFY